MLDDNVKNKIKRHALQNAHEECCGIIILRSGELTAFECQNIAKEKSRKFEISPLEYLKASGCGNIVGFYHSHISENDKITLVDKHYSEGFKLPIILYSVTKDSFDFYNPKGCLIEYIGRDFKIGENDCFTLARDYFKKELDVLIGDYERGEGWMEKTPNLIVDNFEKENFVVVNEQPKRHDAILFQWRKNLPPSHIMIYIGGNKILHHPRDGKSLIEDYNSSLVSRTAMILRHKSQC